MLFQQVNKLPDYPFMVIVFILVMLLLFASFLIVFIISQRKKLKYQQQMEQLHQAQQNQLIEAAVRSEESERHRISEALHDEVGAILSAAKLHIQGIKDAHLDERDKQLYEKGKDLLNEGIQKVRGISHNLHSNILQEFGLNEAIRHFVDKTVRGTIIKTTTQLDDSYTTLSPENDISIYRMVQELINNIMKHSNADKIAVTSTYADNNLLLTLFHTGTGLTQQQFEELRYKKEGLGLKNIMNRIILLRGKIEFTTTEDGYKIIINVPINTPVI
jgi:two-component system, NarL family, sensor kinase